MIDTVRRAEPTRSHRSALEQQQERTRKLLALAEHLDPADEQLLLSVYDRGVSASELARAAGLHPETIRRRSRRLMKRLAGPMFQFVLKGSYAWSRTRREVAKRIFLRGWGQRETAAALGISLHEVRQHAQFVEAAFEIAEAEKRSRR